jgi:hypothetical protein
MRRHGTPWYATIYTLYELGLFAGAVGMGNLLVTLAFQSFVLAALVLVAGCGVVLPALLRSGGRPATVNAAEEA